MQSHFTCVRLCATLWTAAFQGPLSTGLCRQEYRRGLPYPPPGSLPEPAIQQAAPAPPAAQAGSLPLSHRGSPVYICSCLIQLPMQQTWVQCLGQRHPLEKETATLSSILAWINPWKEESGGLQPTGQGIRTSEITFLFYHVNFYILVSDVSLLELYFLIWSSNPLFYNCFLLLLLFITKTFKVQNWIDLPVYQFGNTCKKTLFISVTILGGPIYWAVIQNLASKLAFQNIFYFCIKHKYVLKIIVLWRLQW